MIRSAIKTNCEKFLYILLAVNLFIFLPICAILWLHWLLSEVTVYNSVDSVIMAEEIYLNHNRSINPCDDFYEFACGKYLKFYDDQGFYLRSRQILHLAAHSEFLFKKPNDSLPVGLRYLNDFLYGCITQGSIAEEAERLKKYARLLKFPVAAWKPTDFNPSTDYDYEKLLINLIKKGMHFEAFFQLYVDYTYDDAKPGLFLTSPQKQIMRRVKKSHLQLSYFGALMQENNLIFPWAKKDDISHKKLLKQLFSIKRSRKLKYDDIGKYKRVTLGYILDEFSNIITVDIFKALVGDYEISNNTEIIMTNSEYDWNILKNGNRILANPSDEMKRAITNYVIYRALIYADQFIHDYTSRQGRCIENLFVDKRLEFSFRLIIFHNNVNQQIIDKLKDFVDIMFEGMVLSVNKQSWMSGKTKEKAINKLRKMKVVFGVPKEFRDLKSLNDDPFQEFDYDHSKSFFENSFEINRIARQYEIKEIGKANSKLWLLETVKEPITYKHLKNMLLINNEILLDNILTLDLPEVFKFAFVGTFITTQLCDSLGLIGKHFNELGRLKIWWDKETEQNFVKKINCLIDQYNKFIDPRTNFKINGEDTFYENFNDLCGLRATLSSYDNYVMKIGKGYTIPAFHDYTVRQLFWILYAEAFCSSHSKENINHLEKYYLHSPDRFKVIGTVMNSMDFSRDYHCNTPSKMNPIGKCDIWI